MCACVCVCVGVGEGRSTMAICERILVNWDYVQPGEHISPDNFVV